MRIHILQPSSKHVFQEDLTRKSSFLDHSKSFCQKQPVLDLAACLASLGFAQVTAIPQQMATEPAMAKYHQHLGYVQQRAQRNRNGIWADK